jgi:hypothetical protein
MIISLGVHAQNIEFTFANPQTTNDGANDFYEADIMIATVEGQADFKLGKGQVYINFNTAAFGSNINAGGGLEITYPEVDGYILGLTSGFPYYSTPVQNDNSPARFSFSYQQGISSGSMPTDNVTSTPTKLFHIKMQFTDAGELPMVAFEDNETQPPGVAGSRDQFETACGPSTSGFPDCTGFPGVVFNDALFDSGGATLSNDKEEILEFSIYPNPASEVIYISSNSAIEKIELYDMLGKFIMTSSDAQQIKVNHLNTGVYFVKLYAVQGQITKRIIIN